MTSSAAPGAANNYYGYNNANELCWSGTANGTVPSPGSNCTSNPGPPGDTNYLYDANGNTCWTASTTGTSYTCASAPNGATQYSYNTKNQTTAVGTTAYTYADIGQTYRTAAGTTSYTNGLLGLASQTAGSTNTYFTRDPSGNLIGVRQGSGSTGTSSYDTLDALGSLLADTQANGTTDNGDYTYDPYGNVTSATGADPSGNPYRFATGYGDTNGMLKLGTRYYNPTPFRWTQQDPLSGTIANPSTLDRYLYAGDAPTIFNDPHGETWYSSAEAIFEGSTQLLFGGGLSYTALSGGTFGAEAVGIDFAEIGTAGIVGATATGIGLAVVGAGLLAAGLCELFC